MEALEAEDHHRRQPPWSAAQRGQRDVQRAAEADDALGDRRVVCHEVGAVDLVRIRAGLGLG